MNVTWGSIFDIILKMFETNQNQIAEKLGVNRSTISRLVSGEQKNFRCSSNKIYKHIFDPKEDTSFAHGMLPKDLLETFKFFTKEMNLDGVSDILEEDDYKKCVIGLLHLAKGNVSKSSASNMCHSIDASRTESEIQGLSQKHYNEQNILSNEIEENTIQESIQCEDERYQFAVPQDCEICLCCKNWNGNVTDAYRSIWGVEGECIKYKKNVLSTISGSNCEKFYPNYSRVAIYHHLHQFPKHKGF